MIRRNAQVAQDLTWLSTLVLSQTLFLSLLIALCDLPFFSRLDLPLVSSLGRLAGVVLMGAGVIAPVFLACCAVALLGVLTAWLFRNTVMTLSVIITGLCGVWFLALADLISYFNFNTHLWGPLSGWAGYRAMLGVLNPTLWQWVVAEIVVLLVVMGQIVWVIALKRHRISLPHWLTCVGWGVACTSVGVVVYLIGWAFTSAQFDFTQRANRAYLDAVADVLPLVPVRQTRSARRVLHYPRAPIQVGAHPSRQNILLIVVEGLDQNALRSGSASFLARWSNKTWQYAQHYTGGFDVQRALFALIYSLPSPYASAMLRAHQSPVLLTQLTRAGYQLGFFMPYGVQVPGVRDQQMVSTFRTETSALALTAAWRHFMQTRSKTRPFFTMVYFPNTARDGLNIIDQQVQKMMTALVQAGVLQNTVVMLRAQPDAAASLRAPLWVRWPGAHPKVIAWRTSDYDIVPTLMDNVLNVKTPARDYSVGVNLAQASTRVLMVIGGKNKLALLTKNHLVTIYSDNNYLISTLEGKPLDQDPSSRLLHQGSVLLNQFIE